jgi:hypothetical protein
MNNIEELKHYVDENMKDIKITDDIRKSILKKNTRVKSHALKHVAIIILPMLLITFMVFNKPIGYAAQNILRYVPGINILVEDNNHRQYGILEPLRIKINEENYIVVNSAYTENNSVILNIESNLPLYNNISAIDKNGSIVELDTLDIIQDSETFEWFGSFTYDFSKLKNKFDIVYENYKLPIEMVELPEISSEEYSYISVEHLNAKIATITNYVDDALEISLLTKSNSANQIISLPMNDIYLLDSSGKKYYCSGKRSSNTIYFDSDLSFLDNRQKAGMKLVIPYASFVDESLESSIAINKNTPTPLSVTLGKYDLSINEINWSKQSNSFKFKTENGEYHSVDNQKSQKLELIIDKTLTNANKINLKNISASANQSELVEHNYNGIKLQFSDPYAEENSIKNANIQKIIPNIKNDANKVNITFSSPIIQIDSKITIPLQP